MAHYAFINADNIVVEVITGRDEDDMTGGVTDWEAWYATQREGLTCKRTSYNHRIRKQYAGIGFTYDEAADVFIEPKPYASWTLNGDFDWMPPVPYPESGIHEWDEEVQGWKELGSN